VRGYDPPSERTPVMNCDDCGGADPVFHLTEIVDGVKTDRHLCLKCAAEHFGCKPDATLEEVFAKANSGDLMGM
jgi:protein-arginine kinase activator protein McsA